MKSAVETLSPTRVKLTVEIPFEELKPSLDEAYRSISSQITVPGFRKGKVPQRVIDQRVGRGAVLEEAINAALPKAYDDAVRESGVMPVGRPEVDVQEIKDGEALTFTAEVDVRPEFDLPDYSGLRIEVDDADPTDEDVEEQLTSLRTRFASLVTVDRAAQDGDVLLVDLSGSHEGEPVEDLAGQALSYELGSEGMVEGFDEAVRGAVADETRTFSFVPTAGEWEGTPLDVEVVVRQVRERELPDADDDFAQMASEFDTIDELRADVRERLGRVRRLEQGAQARQKAHELLLEMVDIPLPEATIAAEVDNHFADGHGDGDDDHRAEVETQARESLKSQFLLDKVAETEQLGVSEAELSQWLVAQAPRYGMSPDQFAQALVEAGQVPMAVQEIRRAKALAVVLEGAEVVDASGRPVDLNALDPDLVGPGVPLPHDHDELDDDHDELDLVDEYEDDEDEDED